MAPPVGPSNKTTVLSNPESNHCGTTAAAMPRHMESDDSEDADPEDISDFEVGEEEEDQAARRGRKPTGKRHGSSSPGSSGQRRKQGQQKGPRRPRGAVSPQEERERTQRARQQPRNLDQDEQERREQKRQEKLRRRNVAAAAADEAFNAAFVGEARTTSTSIANQMQHKGCGNDGHLTPLAPRTQVGFHSIVLPFSCQACGALINIATGKRSRINLEVDSEEEEDAAQQPGAGGGGRGGRRKQKKRRQTNARPDGILRAVLGALLSGQTYEDYRASCVAQNLHVIHWSTFNRYLGKLLPWVEKLQSEAVDLVRYLVVRYGDTIDNLVLTHDFFWQTRGHHSRNGTGTVCDRKTGAILSYRHYCQGRDSMSDRGGFEWTSAAMDPISMGEMAEEMIEWMEKDVDKILEKYPDDLDGVEPKLCGVILDGDASTNSLIPVVKGKVRASGETKYCSDFQVYPCFNHLGKNCGGYAATAGHAVHKTCSCEDNLTLKGTVNSKQPKKHRGCNDSSHPLVKSYQRGLTAAVRGAKDWKRKPGYADRSLPSLVIQGVEEMANHFSNIHDGPGFHSGERRVCRLHDATKANGAVYESRQYNDCGDFNLKMQSWLTSHVLENIEEKLHPEEGGMCQNASERVGDVALQYRDKISTLGPTHYICSTGLAIAHVENVVINRFRMDLAADERMDQKIEAWDTMQSRLYDLIGLEYSEMQLMEWRQQVTVRAKRSKYRQTVAFKSKRRDQRSKLSKWRGELRRDHSYQYKGSTGGGRKQQNTGAASKGVVGACQCGGMCVQQCPCKAEGVRCTLQCHGGRSCKNCPAPALRGPAEGSSAAGSSSGRAGGSAEGAAGVSGMAWAGPVRAVQPKRGSTRPDSQWADAEPVPPSLDDKLLGKEVWFHFPPPHGWLKGTVVETNDDPEETDGDEIANYIVSYEDDDQAHDLQHEEYSIETDAPSGSWFVVRVSDDA